MDISLWIGIQRMIQQIFRTEVSRGKKSSVSAQICIYTFSVYIGRAIYTPSINEVSETFGVSTTVTWLGLSVCAGLWHRASPPFSTERGPSRGSKLPLHHNLWDLCEPLCAYRIDQKSSSIAGASFSSSFLVVLVWPLAEPALVTCSTSSNCHFSWLSRWPRRRLDARLDRL